MTATPMVARTKNWSVLPQSRLRYERLLMRLRRELDAPPGARACPPWLTSEESYAEVIGELMRCTDGWRPRPARRP